MKKQQGMSFIGLVLMIAGIVMLAIVAMKLVPVYLENAAVKQALKKIKEEPGFEQMSAKDIASSFDKSATIGDIKNITGKDLLVDAASGHRTVTADYEVRVHLFGNLSAVASFNNSTDK